MKTKIAFVFALVIWATVIAQYVLAIENRVDSIGATTVRFLSYFTILTNSLVAIYMTFYALQRPNRITQICNTPGTLTAITGYIFIVGLVYQILLRHIWEPKGFQRLVDELLHSIIPIVTLLFWFAYENKAEVRFKQVNKWLIYPLAYLIWILTRGYFMKDYPYPFVNVTALGLPTVLRNSFGLLFVFVAVSVSFISIGKWLQKEKIN